MPRYSVVLSWLEDALSAAPPPPPPHLLPHVYPLLALLPIPEGAPGEKIPLLRAPMYFFRGLNCTSSLFMICYGVIGGEVVAWHRPPPLRGRS